MLRFSFIYRTCFIREELIISKNFLSNGLMNVLQGGSKMKTFDLDFYFDLQRFDPDPDPESETPDPTNVTTLAQLQSFIDETTHKLKANVTITAAEGIELTNGLDLSAEDFGTYRINGKVTVPTAKTLKLGTKEVSPTGVSATVQLGGNSITSITGLDAGAGKSITYKDGATTKTYTGGIYVDGTTAYGIGETTNVLSLDSTCLYKITGLKDGATGLTVSDKTVTIPNTAATALDGKTINLVNGTATDYKLAFTAPAATYAWTRDGSTATYAQTNIYTLATGDNPKSITYTASRNVVTITGLENPTAIDSTILGASLAVDETNHKITLKKPATNALASGFTVSTAGYTVELGGTEAESNKAEAPALTGDATVSVLNASAGSAVVTGTFSAGYWPSTDNKTVNYSAGGS